MHSGRREDGAVLVEFALVLTPLLLIIFGFLQFGIALNAKIDATHLTAEGARYIAVNQNPGLSESPATSMQNYIRGRANTDYLKGATVCIEYPTNPATSTSGKVGDPVRVTMARTYSIVPIVGNQLVPNIASLNVTGETTMRLEALPTKVTAGCVV
jgi:Flp pilus assembly protein TadG